MRGKYQTAVDDIAPEEILYADMRSRGIFPEREQKLIPGDRHRTDFVIRECMLAIEVEGQTWRKGGHTSPYGYLKDVYKYNKITLLGWKLLRFTSDMVRNGLAGDVIEACVKGDVYPFDKWPRLPKPKRKAPKAKKTPSRVSYKDVQDGRVKL